MHTWHQVACQTNIHKVTTEPPIETRFEARPTDALLVAAQVPGSATFEGGIPVMTASGEHIGSIGVSGAAASDDGICAQVAIDAVATDLQ